MTLKNTHEHFWNITTRAKAKTAGQSHYFTGRPCVRGHFSLRRTSDGPCMECRCEDEIEQYRKNKKKKIDKQKKWALSNKDKIDEYQRNYRDQNREKINENARKYHNLNPERTRVHRRNRRARKKAADGFHSLADIKRIFFLQRGKCAFCKVSIKKGYHVDHVIALALGGSNWPKNLQLLCEPCNLSKHSKPMEEWARSKGALL